MLRTGIAQRLQRSDKRGEAGGAVRSGGWCKPRAFPARGNNGAADMAQIEGRSSPQGEEVLKTVATRIREARIKAGLTQKQLAEKLDRRQGFVYEIETGEANITLRTLARVADVLDLDARDLLPESRSGALSLVRLNQLLGVLERLAGTLADRQALEARRLAQEAEVVAELRALVELRSAIESAMKAKRVGEDS